MRRIYICQVEEQRLLPSRGLRVVFTPKYQSSPDKNLVFISPRRLYLPFIFWLKLQTGITPTICTKNQTLQNWARLNGIKLRPYVKSPFFCKDFPEPDEVVKKIGKRKLVKILGGILASNNSNSQS